MSKVNGDAHGGVHGGAHGGANGDQAQLNSVADTSSGKLSSQVVAVLATLVSAATVMILNETSLSVALPAIMRDFGINAASAQWLITVFMLTQ